MKHVPDLCLPSNLKIEERVWPKHVCVVSYAELWVMEHNEMKISPSATGGGESCEAPGLGFCKLFCPLLEVNVGVLSTLVTAFYFSKNLS